MVNSDRRPHRSTEDIRKLPFCGFLHWHARYQNLQEPWAFSSHFGAKWPASKFFLPWSSLNIRFAETKGKGRVRKSLPWENYKQVCINWWSFDRICKRWQGKWQIVRWCSISLCEIFAGANWSIYCNFESWFQPIGRWTLSWKRPSLLLLAPDTSEPSNPTL